nr:hypothetical protein FACS1894191_3020 [Clostridia bacterium]
MRFVDGVLTVGANETAATLTVKATSNQDGSTYDTATVTVEDPPQPGDPSVSPTTLNITTGGTGTFQISLGTNGQATGAAITSNNTGVAAADKPLGNHDVTTHRELDGFNGRFMKIARDQAPYRKEQLRYYDYYTEDMTQNINNGNDHDFPQALYRWRHVVNGVSFHFIMLNLAMMEDSDDPKHCADKTISFLTDALKKIGTNDPIFIFQHYGYDAEEVHADDGAWWPQKSQKQFTEMIHDYNVMMIFYGHWHTFEKGSDSYEIENVLTCVKNNYCVGSANSEYDGGEHTKWSVMRMTIAPGIPDEHTGKVKTNVLYEQVSGDTSKNVPPTVEVLETIEVDPNS